MEVSVQLHVPIALLTGKGPPVRTGWEAKRDPAPGWRTT